MAKKTTLDFIKMATEIHGESYDYSKSIYNGNKTLVLIICKKHGEFYQLPNNHTYKKQGCMKCYLENKFLSSKIFIRKAETVHGKRYDYSLVSYVNSKKKITIICNIHGQFLQSPLGHLNGNGCQECGKISGINKNTLTTIDFITKADLIHNGLYNYQESIYKSGRSPICIICSKHGEFWQTAYAHLNGQGCPICKSSKGELRVRQWLKSNNISFEEQKRFDLCKDKIQLPFDFYLPSYNICIEYDGIQHYKPWSFGSDQSEKTKKDNLIKIQNKDLIKTVFCKDNNIGLLRIPYWKQENIESVLNNFINKKCP